MLEQPAGFLSTIQIGITLAGFLGSAFAADSFSEYLVRWICEDLGFTALPISVVDTFSVVVITLILSYFTLIFGELVPKRIAMQKSLEMARLSCRVVSTLAFIARPGWIEQLPSKQWVRGSSPFRRAIFPLWPAPDSVSLCYHPMVGVVQLVRASDCGSECRGFESLYPPLYIGQSSKTSSGSFSNLLKFHRPESVTNAT